jgi:DNA-binding response OmpR family regulator
LNQLAARDSTALPGKRILVVEDNDGLYQALRDSLLDAGYEVFGSCERVCDPVDTVPSSHLDAALVDMDPLGSGRATSLAQQLSKRNVPIVWITERRDASVARTLQMHGRLRKPFTEQELLDSIASAVGKSM